jgi:glycosyltransferase involved in cell wall biosynthesis
MEYHLVTSTYFEFDMFSRRFENDKGPRHVLAQIADKLNAKIHQVNNAPIQSFDRFASQFFGTAEHWALSRNVLSQAGSKDIIYCAGEDTGLPIAFLRQFNPSKPKIAISTMAPERIRTRSFLKFLGLAKKIDLFVVNDRNKYDYIKDEFAVSQSRILQSPEQTDALFFKPGPSTLRGHRPLIASAGLEQRDYLTLANAIEGDNLEVKVCAFSPNLSNKTRTRMPEKLPENMEIRYFEFDELRDLYRSADIVVISLLRNKYSAGLTVLMEAMACKRPIIITRNPGLASDLIDKGLVLGFEPGNSQELKTKINYLLSNTLDAKKIAEKAGKYFLSNHTSDHNVDLLTKKLAELSHW